MSVTGYHQPHDMSHDALAQPLRDHVAAQCAVIASSIQERRSDATLAQLLSRAQTLCEQAAHVERSTTLTAMLMNLKTALETWERVWPRLGRRQEFRAAVAREARLWSHRLGHA